MKYLRLSIAAVLVTLALASCDTVSPTAPAATAPAATSPATDNASTDATVYPGPQQGTSVYPYPTP